MAQNTEGEWAKFNAQHDSYSCGKSSVIRRSLRGIHTAVWSKWPNKQIFGCHMTSPAVSGSSADSSRLEFQLHWRLCRRSWSAPNKQQTWTLHWESFQNHRSNTFPLLTCHQVLSSSDSSVMVVFISNWRGGMPFGGAGVPWYGEIAFTLPRSTYKHKLMMIDLCFSWDCMSCTTCNVLATYVVYWILQAKAGLL